jgi:Glycosyltransferase family 87/WD40-like Beta Propeller Repeat
MNQTAVSRYRPEASEAEARNLDSILRVTRQSPGWLPAVEWFVLAALALTFIGHSFVPAWRTLKSEFPNYYLAAELYHKGIPLDRVYEWTWFQRQNDHWGVRDGLVSFAPNPPTLIFSLMPFTRLQPLAAKRCWLVLSLISLAVALWTLHRVTVLGWRRLILIALLCVLPLSDDFLLARHYVFILFLVCTAYFTAHLERHRTSGAMWSAAAAMKLFPALAVILFLCQRNWRALAGFFVGASMIVTASVIVFGVEVHRVFLHEVLTQASRGDWLGPYALSQNSFSTLWSHLFLIEPELNPAPLLNSSAVYALAMAITVTVLVIPFLVLVRHDKTPSDTALRWAALAPLLLLLCTSTAADYSCLLVFTAIVGVDALLALGDNKNALVLLLLYVAACAPVPHRISDSFPLTRLAATTALYALLLSAAGAGSARLLTKRWLCIGLISVAVLTLFNLHMLRNRAEDFGRHLPIPKNGYRFANPVPVTDGVAFTEMQPSKYSAVLLTGGAVQDVPMSGDVLSVAGCGTCSILYSELTGRKSFVVQFQREWLGSAPETLAEGQEPALSSNGKWLAFIREERGRGTVWLLETDSRGVGQEVLSSVYKPLDVAVTDDGDLIVAAGQVSDPHLLLVRRGSQGAVELPSFPHPARYPSISPDSRRLAFSRRDGGSWHLVVRAFATGLEQQLTHASCNAISPSWMNDQTLLYATDCGRGVGLSTIAQVVVPN